LRHSVFIVLIQLLQLNQINHYYHYYYKMPKLYYFGYHETSVQHNTTASLDSHCVDSVKRDMHHCMHSSLMRAGKRFNTDSTIE